MATRPIELRDSKSLTSRHKKKLLSLLKYDPQPLGNVKIHVLRGEKGA
jgi:hypothetical protein